MDGTEIHTNVREMILVCGHSHCPKMRRVSYPLSMRVNLNVASPNKMVKRLIEFQHGLDILCKMFKTICMKVYSGILVKVMYGRVIEFHSLSPSVSMKLMSEW
jgi:hypothetical protein